MRTRDIFGFLTIGTFAVIGGYKLYQYYNNKSTFIKATADIAKDGMDTLDCISNIYSDNEEDKRFSGDVTELGKCAVDFIANIAEESERYYA
jgi:hypothetical protein